ncbi:anti-sigma factor [Ectothiorhodospiraceae bacterium WFHF3C12]|nr:anti-sigma factor [Ectothiorhodospiraceae bacterium WFHF3C12]
MRYRDLELQDRLAAEYVVGTLHGRARRRFERLMLEFPTLCEAVHGWERQLNAVAAGLPERQPPRRVWRRIRARIQPERRGLMDWLGWPAATATATAAAAVLAVFLVVSVPTAPPESYVAIIAEDATTPLWTVTADPETGELNISAVGTVAAPEGKALELWLMPPASGEKPRSLGLLPEQGSRSVALPVDAARAGGAALAVSVEPPGGSPTGQPTGSVVYQARFVTPRSG